MKNIDPSLLERLEQLITTMGYELIGCEITSIGRQSIFRIYIDSPMGVTVEDCSKVSQQVGALMDVEDPIQSRYSLEVSSPGIDRPLFKLEQYEKFIGKRLKIKLYVPIVSRRQYVGTLLRVEDEHLSLLVDDTVQELKLPFSSIEKANVVGEVHFNGRKGID